jgi:hypothetical protein
MAFTPLLSEGVQLAQLYAESHGDIESATAVALASSGTITTAGIGVSRLAPTAAVTAVVLGTGTTPGQQIWVVNESTTVGNSITMAASGTSNAAGGVNDIIPGLQARQYVWDDQTNLWYATPQVASAASFTPSGSAAATASSGTITTSGVQVARIAPTAAITAVVMAAGLAAGQLVAVNNESAFSVQMAASATSNVADGVNCIIPPNQSRFFSYTNSLWYAVDNLQVGALTDIVSATSPATASSGTITTAGVGTARSTPAAAITAVVLQAGTVDGQEITVVNESTTGANTITFAASATSNVANGVSTVISGLTCAKLKWRGSLWYHMV